MRYQWNWGTCRNAALEEVVMALKVRSDQYPYETGVVSEHFIHQPDVE